MSRPVDVDWPPLDNIPRSVPCRIERRPPVHSRKFLRTYGRRHDNAHRDGHRRPDSQAEAVGCRPVADAGPVSHDKLRFAPEQFHARRRSNLPDCTRDDAVSSTTRTTEVESVWVIGNAIFGDMRTMRAVASVSNDAPSSVILNGSWLSGGTWIGFVNAGDRRRASGSGSVTRTPSKSVIGRCASMSGSAKSESEMNVTWNGFVTMPCESTSWMSSTIEIGSEIADEGDARLVCCSR